jgi:hypothetical protein
MIPQEAQEAQENAGGFGIVGHDHGERPRDNSRNDRKVEARAWGQAFKTKLIASGYEMDDRRLFICTTCPY